MLEVAGLLFSGPAEVLLKVNGKIRLCVLVHAGSIGPSYPRNVNNKEKVALRFLHDLSWRVKSVTAEGDGKIRIELEADNEDVAKALKVVEGLKSLRTSEAERLRKMPVEGAYKELVLMHLVEGTKNPK